MSTDPMRTATGPSPALPVRVSLRPLATPLPLGFLALAVAAFVLSGLQLGWVPAGQAHQVALVMLAFAFPGQLIASLYSFLCRDAAAATGMGVLAVTWLTFGLLLLSTPTGRTSDTAGLLLLIAGVVLLVPAAASGTDKTVVTVVLLTAALRFLLSGAYEYAGSTGWRTAAGVTGLVLVVLALYAALALGLEGQRHRTVLPTLRTGQGLTAVEGDAAEQVGTLAQEPGVRRAL